MAPGSENWTTTARQALPRLWQVTRRLRPTLHVRDVTALDDEFLRRHEVAALLWDVDGTLMAYHDGRVARELEAALDNLRDKVPQAILSNCGEERFGELGAIFEGLPIVKGYRLASSELVFRSRRAGKDRWMTRQPSHLGEAGGLREVAAPPGHLTPLRKPSAELVEVALAELGVERGRRAFMVGDQYFTDIAGANLAGIGSVKVPTVRPDTFPMSIRLLQSVERTLFYFMHGRADLEVIPSDTNLEG